MAFQMTTHSVADTRIVECNERIVLGDESANLRNTVRELLTECKQIVLDLGGVTYIDSIGVGVLVGLLISAQIEAASSKTFSGLSRCCNYVFVVLLSRVTSQFSSVVFRTTSNFAASSFGRAGEGILEPGR